MSNPAEVATQSLSLLVSGVPPDSFFRLQLEHPDYSGSPYGDLWFRQDDGNFVAPDGDVYPISTNFRDRAGFVDGLWSHAYTPTIQSIEWKTANPGRAAVLGILVDHEPGHTRRLRLSREALGAILLAYVDRGLVPQEGLEGAIRDMQEEKLVKTTIKNESILGTSFVSAYTHLTSSGIAEAIRRGVSPVHRAMDKTVIQPTPKRRLWTGRKKLV